MSSVNVDLAMNFHVFSAFEIMQEILNTLFVTILVIIQFGRHLHISHNKQYLCIDRHNLQNEIVQGNRYLRSYIGPRSANLRDIECLRIAIGPDRITVTKRWLMKFCFSENVSVKIRIAQMRLA